MISPDCESRKHQPWLLAVCLFLFFTGCVGGVSPRAFATSPPPPYLTRATVVQGTAPASIPSAIVQSTVTAASKTASAASSFQPPDLDNLRRVMLDAINRDRAAVGLAPVQLDTLSTQAGQEHAEEMAQSGFLSHWNLKGLGPDLRYSILGGRDYTMENAYSYYQRYSSGTPVAVNDFAPIVRDAEASLMTSPGHRANILRPEHTHVGIGIAYNPATGDFRIAQEFVNHYAELDPVPQSASPGDTLVVSGRLLPGVSNPLINLAYESAPRAMSVAELNATSTYSSPARFVRAVQVPVDAQGRFRVNVPLDSNAPAGVYHIRLWVDGQGASVQAADAVVWVGMSIGGN